MPHITGNQMRAARALMNWSQSDLADKAGLWHPTIANIETGKTTPSKATLDKISGVFINHGLEFLDGEGVKKKTETVLTLSGESDFERFYDLVYDAAKTTGGQIFISNVDERIFDEFVQPEFDKFHMHRMEQIRRNIDFRTLVKEGEPPPIKESISGVNPDKLWATLRRHINGTEALYGGADYRIFAAG